MSITKTRRDLVDQSLANLGVPGSGQSPSAEDVATMDRYFDPVVAMLEERSIVEVDDEDAIPVAWFLPISYIMSGLASVEFGQANDPRIILLGDRGEKLLRQMNSARPTYNPATPEYF